MLSLNYYYIVIYLAKVNRLGCYYVSRKAFQEIFLDNLHVIKEFSFKLRSKNLQISDISV